MAKTSLQTADKTPDLTCYRKARDVAKMFGINARTVFRWADAGHVSRYKLNQRVVLFSVPEVESFVLSGRINHGN